MVSAYDDVLPEKLKLLKRVFVRAIEWKRRGLDMGWLKRLEVENFKSYSGCQVIEFGAAPLAAIIGPNGTGSRPNEILYFLSPSLLPGAPGKSNLMDAISFVLGVKSRHLRSQKMQDLVFKPPESETASRRAHVKLVYQLDAEDEGEDFEGEVVACKM